MSNSLNSQNQLITISKNIVNWLVFETKEIQNRFPNYSFKNIRDIFLQGNTLQESVAYLLTFKSLLQGTQTQMDFTISGSLKHITSKSILEILPHPLENELNKANKELESLGVIDVNIATSDIYLENPVNNVKEHLTFILGE